MSRDWLCGANARRCPRFEQIEQLHEITLPRSVVTSYRTRPQWQPPAYVLDSAMRVGYARVRGSVKAIEGQIERQIQRQIADVIARHPRAGQPEALVELAATVSQDEAAALACFDRAVSIDVRCVRA